MNWLAFVITFLVYTGFANCYYVELVLHKDINCRGDTRSNSLDRTCFTYPNWGYEVSAVSMPIGSCAKIYKGTYCSGESEILAYPNDNFCNLPCCNWNDRIFSIQDCTTTSNSINCPSGSYIRQIDFQQDQPQKGMTVHCYRPSDDEPILSKNTHDVNLTIPSRILCGVAAHGLHTTYDNKWKMHSSPVLDCKINQEIITCDGVDSAVTGISVEIDEARVIKEFRTNCRKVPDPSSICEPVEDLRVVVECDNSQSGNEMECSYSNTIGVGQSRTMTESERKEMGFSEEFGFSIGASIFGLSASVSATLGRSELVAYEWSQSDTTTWTEETTISAVIKLRPYSHSKLEQLVGKCSFYGISVNYFKQTDVNSTGEATVTYFAH